jgi:hypothetical protein
MGPLRLTLEPCMLIWSLECSPCTATAIPFMFPFLGIARPQPQFPHSCVCERFIYYQDRSTYFLQQKRQTHRGNI